MALALMILRSCMRGATGPSWISASVAYSKLPEDPGPQPGECPVSNHFAPHGDHDGGVHLTEAAIPGVTIVYGEGDWPSVLERTGPHATRHGPENDGTDGRVISVGDVSVQIVTMPGHTPGTLSFLFEFKDKGQPIRVAYSGGTAISFTNPDVGQACSFTTSRFGDEVPYGLTTRCVHSWKGYVRQPLF